MRRALMLLGLLMRMTRRDCSISFGTGKCGASRLDFGFRGALQLHEVGWASAGQVQGECESGAQQHFLNLRTSYNLLKALSTKSAKDLVGEF